MNMLNFKGAGECLGKVDLYCKRKFVETWSQFHGPICKKWYFFYYMYLEERGGGLSISSYHFSFVTYSPI